MLFGFGGFVNDFEVEKFRYLSKLVRDWCENGARTVRLVEGENLAVSGSENEIAEATSDGFHGAVFGFELHGALGNGYW